MSDIIYIYTYVYLEYSPFADTDPQRRDSEFIVKGLYSRIIKYY